MYTVANIKEEKDGIIFRLQKNGSVRFKKMPFFSYFYLQAEDYEDIRDSISMFFSSEEEVVDSQGKAYIKLTLKNNFLRYKVKKFIEEEGIQTFEADINAPKRWLIDSNTPLNQDNLNFCYIDIETVDLWPIEKTFTGDLVANKCITSIAIKSKAGEVWYSHNSGVEEVAKKILSKKELRKVYLEHEKIFLDGEKKLLKEFFEVAKQYDVWYAYNGERFDFPYIKQRMDKHGLEYESQQCNHIDYMLVYKTASQGSLQSYSLQNVSLHEFSNEIQKENSTFENLGEVGKIDWKEITNANSYFDLYYRFPETLKEYNIQDVNLMDLLEKKLHLTKLLSVKAEITHSLLKDTLFNSKLGDNYLLREYKKINYISESKPTKQVIEKRSDPVHGDHVSGGYTFCFEPGLHKNLHGYDFGSHYPTAIITHNIGKDSFVKTYPIKAEKILSENELKFYHSVLRLYDTRKFLKKDGTLSKGKYDKKVEELKKQHNSSLSMEEIMWKFVKEYRDEEFFQHLKDKNYTASEFDLNYDTKGWRMHPYRVYTRKESVLSKICRILLTERNKVKYELKKIAKEFGYDSPQYIEKNVYQLGLKTLANSMYGITALKSFRDYHFDVADAITSACRMLTKRCILFVRENRGVVTNGDSVTKDTKIKINGEELTIEKYFEKNKEKIQRRGSKDIIDVETNFDFTQCVKNITYKQPNMKKPSERVYQKKAQVLKIIRHKTKKKMYKITTESGKTVVVTSDHSIPVKRDGKYMEPLTKHLLIGDEVYVSCNTGFCSEIAWNKGKKPKEWMNKDKYTKWKKDKIKKSCLNYLGRNTKTMTRTEAQFYEVLKKYGFKFEYKRFPNGVTHYLPDFINIKEKIIVEINGSYHISKNLESSDEAKNRFFEKLGYKIIQLNLDEKFRGRPIVYTEKKIFKILEENGYDLSK